MAYLVDSLPPIFLKLMTPRRFFIIHGWFFTSFGGITRDRYYRYGGAPVCLQLFIQLARFLPSGGSSFDERLLFPLFICRKGFFVTRLIELRHDFFEREPV